jgi:hypothetical protein
MVRHIVLEVNRVSRPTRFLGQGIETTPGSYCTW